MGRCNKTGRCKASKNELELTLPHLPCHVVSSSQVIGKTVQCKSKTRPKTSDFNRPLGLHLYPPSRTRLRCSTHCLFLEDAASREIRCQQRTQKQSALKPPLAKNMDTKLFETGVTHFKGGSGAITHISMCHLHSVHHCLWTMQCEQRVVGKVRTEVSTGEHHRNKLLEACTALLVDAVSTETITKINSVTRALVIISRAPWWHAESCTASESLATNLKKEPPNPRRLYIIHHSGMSSTQYPWWEHSVERTTMHEAQASPQRRNASQTSGAPCHLKPMRTPHSTHPSNISSRGIFACCAAPTCETPHLCGCGKLMPRVRTPSLKINFVSRD